MKFMKTIALAAFVLLTASCGKHTHENEAAPEREQLTYTKFAPATELFVEFHALAKGTDSPFAAHVTVLEDYKALAAGKVTAILSGGGAPEEIFRSDAPSVPGIFRPVAKPQHAGKRNLSFVIDGSGFSDRHDIGPVTVHESEEAAIAAAPKEEESGGGITYLKEQQWKTDFAVRPVTEQTIRGAVAANALIRPRSDGEAKIGAPTAGRLLARGRWPQIGTRVARNQLLGVIAPRVGGDVDVASLQLDTNRARLALDQAQQERQRLERLLAQEAVPERRVIDARRQEEAARADLQAAQSRLGQYRGTQSASGEGAGGQFEVRSPITGTIVSANVAPGEFVEGGRELFDVVDTNRLWLEIQIPEGQVAQVQTSDTVSFLPEGFRQASEASPRTGARVIAIGGIVNPQTRTVPLIFEIPNPRGELKAGMFVRAQVFTPATMRAVVVPIEAVVDEDGQPIVYVMLEGESFERRPVKVGVRQGGIVQILEGLRPGERIVTRGSYDVRLASSSGAVPAHGHAH